MSERATSPTLAGSEVRTRVHRVLSGATSPIRGLDPGSLDMLESTFEAVRTVPARRDIASESEATGHLHLLLEGWAVRSSLLFQGRRHLSAIFLTGDLCDLDRVALDPPGYGVTAVTPCTVALASRSRLRAAMDGDVALRSLLLRLHAQSHASTLSHAASLGRRTAPERVAHLFCVLATRLGGDQPPERFHFPLTQEELAEATGLSVVHVNRTLQTLRAAGLIVLEARRLAMPDWPALCAFAHYTPPPRD